MKRFAIAAALVLALAFRVASAQAPAPLTDRPEDRAALKNLLAMGAEALNTRKFDAIAPHLHPNFHIITVDAGKHNGLEAFKGYIASLLESPTANLKDFKTQLAVDEDTRFIDENTAMSYGVSNDTYTFRDGDVRNMRTRWSAVTRKLDGGWKLVSIQFTTSILDNPIVEGTRAFAKSLAVGTAIGGLLLGLVIALLLRRRHA